ncbi:MAG TPA: hypothetical protein VKA32_10710, partial [Gammaproteobacteria bacterium]|nr:hypothetical protein [Gammaproteobacteria bacterium]
MSVSVLLGLTFVLLLAAAIAGLVLFTLHLRRRPVPARAGFAHAGAALTGVAALAALVFSGHRALPVNAAL